MVVPSEIVNAAIDGDNARVLAWLDADVAERRDANDVEEETGHTLLIAAAADISSVAHVDLARELIRRGADVNVVEREELMSPFQLALLGGETPGERARDFALVLLGGGLALKRSSGNWHPLGTAIAALKAGPTRAYAEVIFALLRAGAPLDATYQNMSAERMFATFQSGRPELAHDEHWAACTKLVADVRAAGGTWTAYRRHPRKQILRLRSLVLRGRARPRVRTRAADPIPARVLRLPNEMCWHVLKFWRATSDATGEVI